MKFFAAFALVLAGTAAAASAQSVDDKMEAFVRCHVYGPPGPAETMGYEVRKNELIQYFMRTKRVEVSRSQYERRRATTPDAWSGDDYTDQAAFMELYHDEAIERIGLKFAKHIWGDQIGTRPQSESGAGQWQPGRVWCQMFRKASVFNVIEFDPRIGHLQQIQTDWTMDGNIFLTGEYQEEQQAVPVSNTSPRRGGDIIIQDATPTQATPEQMAASLLQSQREDAARMAKAAAESARNNADIQAKIARAVEEARKRGNKQ